MKMAKASSRDIDAAGDAMGVMSDISKGYYPDRTGGDEDRPFYFDEEDPAHLRLFYDLINETLDRAPGWPGRVIGGMCFVICYDRNQILDPGQDVLDLHPDLREGLALLKQHRADFLPRLEREARAAVASAIEAAAARHLQEMAAERVRIGKKAAGRLLDGREWDEAPT